MRTSLGNLSASLSRFHKVARYGILLPKLFWPTVRKTFEIRGWRNFLKIINLYKVSTTKFLFKTSENVIYIKLVVCKIHHVILMVHTDHFSFGIRTLCGLNSSSIAAGYSGFQVRLLSYGIDMMRGDGRNEMIWNSHNIQTSFI